MRPHLFIPHIFWLTLLLLQACSPSPQRRALYRAESLLDSHPDSALVILDSIDRSASLDGDDRMLAMLLRVQANDKCYVTPTSDSTIRKLLSYYIDGGHDRGRHPVVLYYAGRTYSDLGKSPLALEYFKKSLRLLGDDGDPDLRSRIHAQMASLFLHHHMYRHALKHTKAQIECETDVKDSIQDINSRLLLAFVFRCMSMNDSAEYIYNSLARPIMGINDSITQSVYISQAADFFRETDRPAEADSLLSQFNLEIDNSNSTSLSTILNEYDENKGDYRSMETRSLEMLRSQDIYAHRNAYKNLARINLRNNRIKESIYYTEKFMAVADSITEKEASATLNGVEEILDFTELENSNAILEAKNDKGIFPASVDFTTDLHSMGQWIQAGERTIFETAISVKEQAVTRRIPEDADNLDGINYLAGRRIDEVNKMAELGTRIAHVDGGVPNILIEIDRLDEHSLGRLIYFFEKACGVSGYMLGVNPFNQPGVEDYKRNMFALLEKPGYEKETEAIKAKPNDKNPRNLRLRQSLKKRGEGKHIISFRISSCTKTKSKRTTVYGMNLRRPS